MQYTYTGNFKHDPNDLEHKAFKYISKKFKQGKWVYTYHKNRLKRRTGVRTDDIRGSKDYYLKLDDKKYGDSVGIEREKGKFGNTLSFYDTRDTTYFDNDEEVDDKKFGPFTVSYAEDGVRYTLDLDWGKKKVKDLSEGSVGSGKQLTEKLLKKKG